MDTNSTTTSNPYATPGYQGAVVEIPLKPCCLAVFLGEECGCDWTMPVEPPIFLDLRAKAGV